MPRKKHVEEDKGRQVRVVGRKYEGRLGWVHKNANRFTDKTWIIVAAGRNAQGREEVESARLIAKEDISFDLVAPASTTIEDVIFVEHKDIKNDMIKLAKKLASIEGYDPNPAMVSILLDMWSSEKMKRNSSKRVGQTRFVRNIGNEGWVSDEDEAHEEDLDLHV